MIRLLIASPLLIIALGLGALYAAYGEVDPCRVLAVEQMRRSTVNLPGMETWMRLQTSQMSEGRCTKELLKSWYGRLRS